MRTSRKFRFYASFFGQLQLEECSQSIASCSSLVYCTVVGGFQNLCHQDAPLEGLCWPVYPISAEKKIVVSIKSAVHRLTLLKKSLTIIDHKSIARKYYFRCLKSLWRLPMISSNLGVCMYSPIPSSAVSLCRKKEFYVCRCCVVSVVIL